MEVRGQLCGVAELLTMSRRIGTQVPTFDVLVAKMLPLLRHLVSVSEQFLMTNIHTIFLNFLLKKEVGCKDVVIRKGNRKGI